MEVLLKVIMLGIVQGLTEFLPISSSGHLLLGRKLLGLSDAGLLLDTMLHLGTLIAVVVVFWKDIVYMIQNPFSKLSLLIVTGTIPTIIIGFTFMDFFEEIALSGLTVGWGFLITGTLLWVADNMKAKGTKDISEISFKDALIVGTLQGAAIFPAVSRSGSTIAGALFRGINRQSAARFSFLLSLPAIIGAVILQGAKLAGGQIESTGFVPLIFGTLAAALSGYVAVKWMLAILQRGSLKIFSFYVWFLGVGVLGAQFLGKF